MKSQIASLIKSILEKLGVSDVEPQVEVPEDPAHGDYTTNVAMRLKSNLQSTTYNLQPKSPMEVALWVKKSLESRKTHDTHKEQDQKIGKKHQNVSGDLTVSRVLQDIDRVDVAPPGFINIFLTEASLVSHLQEVLKSKEAYGIAKSQLSVFGSQLSDKGQPVISQSVSETLKTDNRQPKIMVEFAHPNTHKAFHIGHLRNITTGESIVRLLESQGYKVIRANYQGDVGMHIAKALFALLQRITFNSQLTTIRKKGVKAKVEFLGKAYAAGSKAFDEDTKAQENIKDINYLIYAAAQRLSQEKGIAPSSTDYMTFVHGRETDVEKVYELWKETRQWSLDYFETIYKRVGTHYDRYYFEGECLAGVDLAHEAVKQGVLKQSDGAIIFDGKPYGLHTRVFVNSLGLPTYEGKELKLASVQFSEHGHLDKLIHVLGPEQVSFTQVTFKVEELLGIQKGQQHHLVYGWVKLKKGKMSSRSGNVVLGEWLLDEAKQSIYKILEGSESKMNDADLHLPGERNSHLEGGEKDKEEIAEKAAVAAVKYSFLRVSTQSEISFDLKESISFEGDSGPYLQYTYARCKSVLRKADNEPTTHNPQPTTSLNLEERTVTRLITYFPDVVSDAARDFAPSTLCTYLFKLAQVFNLFYAKHSILENTQRLALTAATAQVLKNGLYLLGIEVLEKM